MHLHVCDHLGYEYALGIGNSQTANDLALTDTHRDDGHVWTQLILKDAVEVFTATFRHKAILVRKFCEYTDLT